MIRFVEQNIQGVFLVENFTAQDSRGVFVKTLSVDKLQQNGFTSPFSESYYSKSFKNVIRGMHFQTPPFEHDKLVYVTEGAILDVILDIRTTKEEKQNRDYTTLLNQSSHPKSIAGCL